MRMLLSSQQPWHGGSVSALWGADRADASSGSFVSLRFRVQAGGSRQPSPSYLLALDHDSCWPQCTLMGALKERACMRFRLFSRIPTAAFRIFLGSIIQRVLRWHGFA